MASLGSHLGGRSFGSLFCTAVAAVTQRTPLCHGDGYFPSHHPTSILWLSGRWLGQQLQQSVLVPGHWLFWNFQLSQPWRHCIRGRASRNEKLSILRKKDGLLSHPPSHCLVSHWMLDGWWGSSSSSSRWVIAGLGYGPLVHAQPGSTYDIDPGWGTHKIVSILFPRQMPF